MLTRARILLGLAFRNVLRQARRSILTASAMVLGLALLMITRAIADGAHESWVEAGVRLGPGHVSLEARGYRTSRSLDDHLDPGALAAVRRALRSPALAGRVRAVSVRLAASGLASSPSSAVPVRITGVDPAAEAAFSPLPGKLTAGRWLRPGERRAAVVGQALAERLGLRLGSRLVLTAQSADGQIEGQLVRVEGIFRSGVPELDQGAVQVPLETARAWLGVPGGATGVALLLGSSRETEAVVAALRSALRPVAGVEVLGWREAAPELDSAVRLDDYGDYVFVGILLFIVALAILNAVLMSVLHRTRELGVLQALGLSRRQTGAVVFTEGLLLALLSGLLGVALGLGVTWAFWRHGLDLSALMGGDLEVSGVAIEPVIVPQFRAFQVLQSLGWILVIGVAAALYPAWTASRIDVAEAMKFER